jgi:hypothetical protein
MGHRVCQLLATLCVASSLALLALGGSDPTRWVLPLNPKLWQSPRQLWDLFWIWLWYPTMYGERRVRSRIMCKIIFTVPFYHAFGAQSLYLLGCYTTGL